MPVHHKLYVGSRGSGGGAPIDLLNINHSSGLNDAPLTLTINSQTVSPYYVYRASDADLTDWTPASGSSGGTLTAMGSGGTANLDAPTPGPNDRGVRLDATRYYESSAADDLTSEDFVIELVARADLTLAQKGFVNNRNSGTLDGWSVEMTATGELRLTIDDGTTSVDVDSATGSIEEGAYFVAHCVVDRSGSAQWYIQGEASGTATVVSAVGALSNTDNLILGARLSDASDVANGPLNLFAMWRQDTWLDSHTQTAVIRARFSQLVGVYSPGIPRKPDNRATPAFVERISHVDSVTRYLCVGSGWPRVDRIADTNSLIYDAYLAEEVRINDIPNNTTLTALNTITNATLAQDGTQGPVDEQAWGLTATGVGDIAHLAGHDQGVGGQRSGFVFVHAGARTRCFIERSSGNGYHFDLTAGTVGTQVGTITPRTQDLGDGWYKLGFDIDLTSQTILCYATQSDGDTTYDATADSGAVALYLSSPQLEVGTSTGEAATSPIRTTGIAATRIADQLTYDITGIDLSVGTMATRLLHPDAVPENNGRPSEISDLTGANRHTFTFNGLTGEARAIMRAGGVSSATLVGTTVLTDNVWHDYRVTWAQDDFELFVDGVSEATDNLGNIPAAFTELGYGVSLADTKQPNARIIVRLFATQTTGG